ncbi:MAG: diguanylate cyclase [Anaerolineaceae bacterium]
MNRVNRLIASCLDGESIAITVLNHINSLVNNDICVFAQSRADTQEYSIHCNAEIENCINSVVLSDLVSITSFHIASDPLLIYTKELPPRSQARLAFEKLWISKILITAISSKDRMLGIFLMGFRDPKAHVSEFEKLVASFIARQSATAFDNAELVQNLKKQNNQLEVLYQTSLKVNASLDLKDVIDSVLESIMSLFPKANDAHIFLYEADVLTFGVARWAKRKSDKPFANPRSDGITYRVARTGQPVIVNDMATDPLFIDIKPKWKGGIVGIPLISKGKVVGVMNLAYKTAHNTNEEELRLLRLLGDQAAIAIENARLHHVIENQALTDALTGIANRRAFGKRLHDEILRSARYDHTFALIAVDVDNFKLINDTYGHPTGDNFLIQFTVCMQAAVRDTDFIARTGGDEFEIILPESDLENAKQIVNRLEMLIAQFPFDLPDNRISQFTASFGIAVYPEQALNGEGLINFADQALYLYKRQKTADAAPRRAADKDQERTVPIF